MPWIYRHSLWLAPLITFVGFVSYYLVFARIPVLRDFPWVNLPLVILGASLAIGGLFRGWKDSRWMRRVFLLGGTVFSVGLAALLALYVFVISNQMPSAEMAAEKLVAGSMAPEFSLTDANGNAVSLADYRGRKVVLSFYRGFW